MWWSEWCQEHVGCKNFYLKKRVKYKCDFLEVIWHINYNDLKNKCYNWDCFAYDYSSLDVDVNMWWNNTIEFEETHKVTSMADGKANS